MRSLVDGGEELDVDALVRCDAHGQLSDRRRIVELEETGTLYVPTLSAEV